ncbi:MAG TPA: pilin [Gammaproteobacteria bacterium]|nr:pilin [Gammaproteobacteria bacterium]
MNKAQKGFTLIELMIVIAIIGILAAIAIPQYQDYVTRSKVTEGLNLAAAAKTAVAETFQAKGSMPTTGTNASFGLPTGSSISGTYVKSISVATGTAQGTGGAITITYGAADANLNTKILVLTPVTTAGGVAWTCGYAKITVAGTAYGPYGATTVLSKYLPQNCRA